MKDEKGITLASLVIYVLIFTAVLSILASLTNYIYPRLNNINMNSISSEEFNKFNVYFVQDIKQSESGTIKTDEQGNIKIILSNGANYNYILTENSIYRNKNKIARKILKFKAEIENINEKKIIKVTIGTGSDVNNINFGKTINYVLKYW